MNRFLQISICLLTVLITTPASANSIEDAICGASRTAVGQMDSSEKLCRSFALALPKLPSAFADDTRALLTPANIALMVTLTATWAGTQGVPVVGQAVDAALLALGVTLLAIQAAQVADSLWQYAHRARTAQNSDDLNSAAHFLAQAISRAGVNVVAFVLTKKMLGKIRPEPPAPTQRLITPEGLTEPTTSAPASTPGKVIVPAVASTGTGSPPRNPSQETGSPSPKTPNPKAFAAWIARALKIPVRGETAANRYQIERAGPNELKVSGGGTEVRADGVRINEALLIEVKHVENPGTSPYVPGSSCNAHVRSMIRDELIRQLRRYAAVIRDPDTPAVALELITNETRAVPWFEALMREAGVPGRVVVSP